MTIEELSTLENEISEEWTRRKKLGGYSTDADVLLKLCEWMHLIVSHNITEKMKNE